MLLTYRLLSPLAHGDFVPGMGNASPLRRIPLMVSGEVVDVPAISGNAIRGRFRRLLMRDLLHRADLHRGNVPEWDRLYAALANGGHLDGHEVASDPARIREIRAALPPLSVLGAALYTWMLPGRCSVGFGWPVCRETKAARVIAGHAEASAHAEELVTEIGMVRHVDRDRADVSASGVTPMPTVTEAMVPGAMIACAITFAPEATPVERAAIAWAAARIESLGAKDSSGFGRIEIAEWIGGPDEAPYAAWLDSEASTTGRDALLALAATLGRRGKKPRKGGGDAGA